MEEKDIIGLLLPDGMLEFFDIKNVESSNASYVIHLEEKNVIPENHNEHKLVSKGFHAPVTIQDFPLRGKPCYLKIKRRRWLDQDLGLVVSRDWNLVAKGTRMTVEFATFLKEFNRYLSR